MAELRKSVKLLHSSLAVPVKRESLNTPPSICFFHTTPAAATDQEGWRLLGTALPNVSL